MCRVANSAINRPAAITSALRLCVMDSAVTWSGRRPMESDAPVTKLSCCHELALLTKDLDRPELGLRGIEDPRGRGGIGQIGLDCHRCAARRTDVRDEVLCRTRTDLAVRRRRAGLVADVL